MADRKQKREPGRWAKAVVALLQQPTIQKAAEAAGVGETTLRRWLRSPRFLRLFRKARLAMVEFAVGQLNEGTAEAVATLRRNLTCAAPGVEVRSALGMIALSLQGVRDGELADRIELLERQLRGPGAPAGDGTVEPGSGGVESPPRPGTEGG